MERHKWFVHSLVNGCSNANILLIVTQKWYILWRSDLWRGKSFAYWDSTVNLSAIFQLIADPVKFLMEFCESLLSMLSTRDMRHEEDLTKKLRNNSYMQLPARWQCLQFVHRIHQIPHAKTYLWYMKMRLIFRMINGHTATKVYWIIDHNSWKADWNYTRLGDEERFTLHVLYGLTYL